MSAEAIFDPSDVRERTNQESPSPVASATPDVRSAADPDISVVASLRNVRFSYDRGATWALDGVDLDIRAGESLCLMGPNGSGKSTLSKILAGLIAPDHGVVELLGSTVFDDDGPRPQEYRRARRSIGAVFQNPEDQIVTTVVQDDIAFGPENLGFPRERIGDRMAYALDAVDMARYRDADPTHMSGGQQQRIAIAGALAMEPRMIVLDEPTAMLDTVARHDVVHTLHRMHQAGTTIVHVTHLADETPHADRIIRLDHGRIVADIRRDGSWPTETSTLPEFIQTPRDRTHDHPDAHPDAVVGADGGAAPDSDATRPSCPVIDSQWRAHTTEPAIEVSHVSKHYGYGGATVINDLSFSVSRGETVAIMGRNGSGKTTLARMICALTRPDSGTIRVGGLDVTSRSRRARKALRRETGFIMQRPERQLFARTVAADIAYGPGNQGLSPTEVRERVDEAMTLVHISHLAQRSPFSLSGGQQRLVAIAGILACRPNILVMDEPTASLDARAKTGIHDLVHELRTRGVTMLLITHSPQEAASLCDRTLQMPTPDEAADMDAATGTKMDSAVNEPAETPRTTTTSHDHSDHVAIEGRTAVHPVPSPSFIASLDPRVKLVSFLALMFTAFTVVSPAQLIATAVMVTAMTIAARMHPRAMWRSISGFLALFAAMGLLNVFFVRGGRTLATVFTIPITTDGLMVAVLYTSRLAMVIILGAILLATTMPTSLTDAVGSLLSPLRRRVHTQELALVMSLALRFMPTLTLETHAIIDAQAARGGSIETGSLTQRIRALGAILIPVFAGTLRHADNLSLALDARCYEEGIHRTHWRRMSIAARDIVFATLCAAYIVLLIALMFL